MSWRVKAWVNEHSTLRGGARSVLNELAAMANDDGRCWPSLDTIAQRVGLSRRQVVTNIAKLEVAQAITVEHHRGRTKGNAYRVLMVAKCEETSHFIKPENVKSLHEKCEVFAPENVKSLHEKCEVFDTKIGGGFKDESLNESTDESQNDDDDGGDDAAAWFRAELADIAWRTVTRREIALIDRACATAEGRSRMGEALTRLRAFWRKVRERGDVTVLLGKMLLEVEQERWVPCDDREFAPWRQPEPGTLDDLRYEHAIEPEALPPLLQVDTVDVSDGAWAKVKAELQLQLASSTYYTWLHNTTAVHWEEERVVITTANTYARDWLDNRLKGVVQRTVRSVTGCKGEIVFEVAE